MKTIEFSIRNSPIIFITGLSGSGKSTLAKRISLEKKAIHIELDEFEHNKDSSGLNILDGFKTMYPKTIQHFANEWKGSGDKLLGKYFDLYMQYLIDYCNKDKRLFVIEGIQIYNRVHPNTFKKYSLIIVSTSVEDCLDNQRKRDNIVTYDISRLLRHEKLLNQFINRVTKSDTQSYLKNI